MTVLHVLSTDMATLQQGIQEKLAQSPQLFTNSPFIVDTSRLGESCQELDLFRLRTVMLENGLIPVGIRNLPESCREAAQTAGWAILRNSKLVAARQERGTEEPSTQPSPTANQPCPGASLMLIDRPLRSGQQVYFPQGSVVVLQHTSAGSEILAGGSVHIYGSLRGRVLAGVHGDTSARIFCQKLEAELVAIAGHYRLVDDMETSLKGSPAMVWLEGEKLKIAPMF